MNYLINYIILYYIIYLYLCFFFLQVNQPGIETGHPRTLYPDDVIRKIIGHEGHPIYDVNEVLIISHF